MWLWLGKKIGPFLAGLGALILAIGAALVYGLEKGKKYQQAKDLATAAQKAVAEANAAAKVLKNRQEVENEVSRLPEAPRQEVDTAKPGTAAADLNRWVRDVSNHDPS